LPEPDDISVNGVVAEDTDETPFCYSFEGDDYPDEADDGDDDE